MYKRQSATCPASTEDHAGGGQFIFGLNDGHIGVSVVVGSESWNVVDDAFSQRRGRRDGVPCQQLHTAVVGAKSRSFISFDEELGGLNFSGFNSVRVGFGQVLFAVISAQTKGGDVEFNRCGFALELLGDG